MAAKKTQQELAAAGYQFPDGWFEADEEGKAAAATADSSDDAGDGGDEPRTVNSFEVPVLEAYAERHDDVQPEGTGANGNVVKRDLVAAIEGRDGAVEELESIEKDLEGQ